MKQISEPESLPVEEIKSYEYASDEGIKAVVEKVRKSGFPFTWVINPDDLEAVMLSMQGYYIDAEFREDVYRRVAQLMGGIAASVGIDWTTYDRVVREASSGD